VLGGHFAAESGGAQFQALCLTEAVAGQRDFETFYLANVVPPQLHQNGYEIVPYGPQRKTGKLGVLPQLPSLYRTLRRVKPKLIYQRCLMPYTGACALFKRRHGAKMVFHVAHDDDVRRPHFKGWGPRMLMRRLIRRVSEYGLLRADFIIAQTDHQAQLMQQEYGLHAAAVLPNFHPMPGEVRTRSAAQGLRVIWVANIKPAKNPELFVALAEAFANRSDVHFTMIGNAGDAKRYVDLHQRIARLKNLDYLGELPVERVNQEIVASDVFVCTSFSEGFPNVFIQAWLRGVAVVSVDVDPDKCLSQGGAGIVAGSDENLFKVIADLAADPARVDQLGARAQAYAQSHHGPERARDVVEFLRRCAASRPGKA